MASNAFSDSILVISVWRLASSLSSRFLSGIEPEVSVYGMDTALRAEIGPADAPAIAVLAEFDALPGIGHGCGHNVMCANSVGAFLALVDLARRGQWAESAPPGRVVLQTTPAEECDTAKERLVRAGMLDGVDAAIQTHAYACRA